MKITTKSAASEEKKAHNYLKQSSRRMSHQWELSIDWFRTTGAVDGRLGAVYGTECRRRHRDDRLRHRVPYTAPRRPSTASSAVHGTETTVYGTRCRLRHLV
uniref:Uncharacterized protein n=1 Tax=Haemonchus contortus TaxID=6289 RepID=A0A7I4YLM7_HAECO